VLEKATKTLEPVIVSASRATDIPAFYMPWLMEKLDKGFLHWTNPFNQLLYEISFRKTRLIVFWSKNPRPLLGYLDAFDEKYPNYYIQYTLNDYDTSIESLVPPLSQRIETFMELSEKIGRDKVLWRFDPILFTDSVGVDEILKRIENIGNQIKNHTRKLIISFADIENYRKVQLNLQRHHIPFKPIIEQDMIDIAIGLQQLNRNWNFEIGTCAEAIDLEKFGIVHNKCIDDDLIIRLFGDDKDLMGFLGNTSPSNKDTKRAGKLLKDKGQRKLCGCIASKDIGRYNTCSHGCVYCYANHPSKEKEQL